MTRAATARRPTPAPLWTPRAGHDGVVASVADFAKCSAERRGKIMQAVQVLVARATHNVERGVERYRRTIREAEEEMNADREFLAGLLAFYVDLSAAMARSAAEALEQTASNACDSGSGPKGEAGTAECEAPQSGGEAASPNPSSAIASKAEGR